MRPDTQVRSLDVPGGPTSARVVVVTEAFWGWRSKTKRPAWVVPGVRVDPTVVQRTGPECGTRFGLGVLRETFKGCGDPWGLGSNSGPWCLFGREEGLGRQTRVSLEEKWSGVRDRRDRCPGPVSSPRLGQGVWCGRLPYPGGDSGTGGGGTDGSRNEGRGRSAGGWVGRGLGDRRTGRPRETTTTSSGHPTLGHWGTSPLDAVRLWDDRLWRWTPGAVIGVPLVRVTLGRSM